MDTERLAEVALRELERMPVCDAPSCIERATQRGTQCPHGRKLPREAPKPQSREPRDWKSATDAEVNAELRRQGVHSH
jgi:hypothetical protein